MTTTTELRDAIVAKVTAITDIGKVHKYERYAKKATDLKELYVYNSRVQGWMLRRAGFKKTQVGDGHFDVRTHWELRGYLSLDDADKTELIMDGLIDMVQMVISNDHTFSGKGRWIEEHVVTGAHEPMMFCGVLCHGATLTFDTKHQETTTIGNGDIGSLDDFNTVNAQYDIPPHVLSEEHQRWLAADYTNSRPELDDTIDLTK